MKKTLFALLLVLAPSLAYAGPNVCTSSSPCDNVFTKRLDLSAHVGGVGLEIPNSAGVPSPVSGQREGDLVWDATSNQLYVYDGASFVSVGGAGAGLNEAAADALYLRLDGANPMTGVMELGATAGTHDPILHLHSPGATDGNSVYLENGSGQFSFFVAGGADNFVPGTLAGDGGVRIGASNKLVFGSSSVTRMVLDSSNRLSIGTSLNNSNMMLIYGGAGNTRLQFTNLGTGTNSSDGSFVGSDSDGIAYFWNWESNDAQIGTSGTLRLRIDSTGLVGLNTAGNTLANKLVINNTDGGGNSYIQFTNSGDGTGFTASDGAVVGRGNDGVVYIYNFENVGLQFGTNNTVYGSLTESGVWHFGGYNDATSGASITPAGAISSDSSITVAGFYTTTFTTALLGSGAVTYEPTSSWVNASCSGACTLTLTETNITPGRIVTVINNGSFDITLADSSDMQTAGNTLQPDDVATLLYNGARWIQISFQNN